nr:unnamed protein product [Spirometra erinaceieuropaei]
MTTFFEGEYTINRGRIKWTCPLQSIPDTSLLKNLVKRLVSSNESVRRTAYLAARDLIKHSRSDFLIKSLRHGGLSSMRTVFYEADPFAQRWNGIAACMNLVQDLVGAGSEVKTYLLSRWQLLLRPLKLQYEALKKVPVYDDLGPALNNEAATHQHAGSNVNNSSDFQEHIRDFYQKLRPQIADDPTKNLDREDVFAFSEFLRHLETIFLTAQDVTDEPSVEELFQANKLLDPAHSNVVFEEGKFEYAEGDILPGPRLDYDLEEDRLEGYQRKLGVLPYAEDFVFLSDNNLRSIQLFSLEELPVITIEKNSAANSVSTEKPFSGTYPSLAECDPQRPSHTKPEVSLATKAQSIVRTAVKNVAGRLSDLELANNLERALSEEAALTTRAQCAVRKALENVTDTLGDAQLSEKVERAMSAELFQNNPTDPNPSLQSDIGDTASTDVYQAPLSIQEGNQGTGINSPGSQTSRSSFARKGSGAQMLQITKSKETNFNKLTPLSNCSVAMMQRQSATGPVSSVTATGMGASSPTSEASSSVDQKGPLKTVPTFKGSAPLEGRRRKFTKKLPKPSSPDSDLESDRAQPIPCFPRSRAVADTGVFLIRRTSSCSRNVCRRSLESSASTVNAF